MSPFRFIAGFLLYLVIRLGMLILAPMNHRVMRNFSNIGAWVMHSVPYLRNLCIKNIHAAFPEMPPEKVRETAWKSLQNLALTVCEIVWIMQHPEQFEKFVDISPCRGAVEEAIRATRDGRGSILLTPHLGNWEFASRVLAYTYKLPIGVVVKSARVPFLDRILSSSRRCGNVRIIYAKGAARAMKNALDEKLIVGILIDQNTKVRNGGVFVDFMGLKIPVSRAPAVLARANGGNRYIAIGAVIRDSPDTCKVYSRELPKPAAEYETDEELIQDITDITADFIRMAPEQYCWLYHRFQYIPPDTPEEVRKRYPDYAKVPGRSFFRRNAGNHAKETS